MHLKQALLYARVNTSGDDAQDLHALARLGGDATSVPQGGGGQIAYGVFGSSEHVAPQKFTLGEGFRRAEQAILARPRWKGGDEA